HHCHTLFPYTTLFRSSATAFGYRRGKQHVPCQMAIRPVQGRYGPGEAKGVTQNGARPVRCALLWRIGSAREQVVHRDDLLGHLEDRKSTRLNSSHVKI